MTTPAPLDASQLRALKAQLLLDQLDAAGLSLEDLLAMRSSGTLPSQVTLRRYLPTVRAAAPAGSSKVYASYWALLDVGLPNLCGCGCAACLAVLGRRDDQGTQVPCACLARGACSCPKDSFRHPAVTTCADTYPGLGNRPLAAITTAEIEAAQQWAKTRATKRWAARNARRAAAGRPGYAHSGKSAEEHVRDAASFIFTCAIDDPTTGVRVNTALKAPKPRRPKTTARAYSTGQLAELWDAIFTTGGEDAELDMRIFWFHLETGARRGGALALRTGGLDVHGQNALLSEKGENATWQPMSTELQRSLVGHAIERGEVVAWTSPALDPKDVTVDDVAAGRARLHPDRPVFYYRRRRSVTLPDGTTRSAPHPLTARRYNSLWDRLCRHVPWADQIHARPHDLRKTGAEFIERACGYAVAKAWLRHADGDQTLTYTKAKPAEIARGFELYTGRSHPLAAELRPPGGDR